MKYEPDIDPLSFRDKCWPWVEFYPQQIEIIYSVLDNHTTVVPAGNQLGKDFVSAFICLWIFMAFEEVRVLTTSVKDEHLNVLWGEITKFINTSRIPLVEIPKVEKTKGAPWRMVHHKITKNAEDPFGKGKSYILGTVADDSQSLAGHHVTADENNQWSAISLYVQDEASSMNPNHFDAAQGWAKRNLMIGNTEHCSGNQFVRAVVGTPGTDDIGGDRLAPDGTYDRKVIRIKAEDSPNVKYARLCHKQGKPVDPRKLIPGILTLEEYDFRRRTWDPLRQLIGLDVEFPKGAEHMLFPEEWLKLSAQYHRTLNKERRGLSMGVDPGEGSAESSWTIVDHQGVVARFDKRTVNTMDIWKETVRLIQIHNLQAEQVWFDRGAGLAHAQLLQDRGYPVHTVSFGVQPKLEMRRGNRIFPEKVKEEEERQAYASRRVFMYWSLRTLIQPVETSEVDRDGNPIMISKFGIPGDDMELRRQLLPFPLQRDKKGVAILPPKNRGAKTTTGKGEERIITMTDLIGCSPDRADSLVLAVYGLLRKPVPSRAGAVM